MIPMTAREAPDTQVVRVIATMRPVEVVEGGRRAGVYAVFDDEEGIFLGLVAGAGRHPVSAANLCGSLAQIPASPG